MNNLNRIIKKVINEATADTTVGRGGYVPPIQPGLRPWNKKNLGPYIDSVSNFKSPLVQYDSYDHKFDIRKKI